MKITAILLSALFALPVINAAQADENIGEKVEASARDAKRNTMQKKRKKNMKNKAKEAKEDMNDKAVEAKNKVD
jgi:hypothetical protein